jgi:membrane protein YqaA with SNARE-associated domain
MEWILMAVIAFVGGGLIGVKLGRARTDVRQRKSVLEWGKGKGRK